MIPPLILTYMSGPDDGRTEIISIDGDDATVTIGRLPECTISITSDPDASRRHARIFLRDGEWWLEDLGSANGTFIGEFAQSEKISGPVKLLPGQIFRIGLTRFRLEKKGYQVTNLAMVASVTEGSLSEFLCVRHTMLPKEHVCQARRARRSRRLRCRAFRKTSLTSLSAAR